MNPNEFYFKILLKFLLNQSESYDDSVNLSLGVVLGDMSTNTWIDRKPADPAVWDDWNAAIKDVVEAEDFSVLPSIREQACVAAFNFLNEFYWANNNNVRLGEVIEYIKNCINEIDKGNENSTWREWVRYFNIEKNNEYHFE